MMSLYGLEKILFLPFFYYPRAFHVEFTASLDHISYFDCGMDRWFQDIGQAIHSSERFVCSKSCSCMDALSLLRSWRLVVYGRCICKPDIYHQACSLWPASWKRPGSACWSGKAPSGASWPWNVHRGKQRCFSDSQWQAQESEKFRQEYCQLWQAMFLHDMQVVSSICKSWGIQEPEVTASLMSLSFTLPILLWVELSYVHVTCRSFLPLCNWWKCIVRRVRNLFIYPKWQSRFPSYLATLNSNAHSFQGKDTNSNRSQRKSKNTLKRYGTNTTRTHICWP